MKEDKGHSSLFKVLHAVSLTVNQSHGAVDGLKQYLFTSAHFDKMPESRSSFYVKYWDDNDNRIESYMGQVQRYVNRVSRYPNAPRWSVLFYKSFAPQAHGCEFKSVVL